MTDIMTITAFSSGACVRDIPEVSTGPQSLISFESFEHLMAMVDGASPSQDKTPDSEAAVPSTMLYQKGTLAALRVRHSAAARQLDQFEEMVERLLDSEPTVRLKVATILTLLNALIEGIDVCAWLEPSRNSYAVHMESTGRDMTVLGASDVEKLLAVPTGTYRVSSPEVPKVLQDRLGPLGPTVEIHQLVTMRGPQLTVLVGGYRAVTVSARDRMLIDSSFHILRQHLQLTDYPETLSLSIPMIVGDGPIPAPSNESVEQYHLQHLSHRLIATIDTVDTVAVFLRDDTPSRFVKRHAVGEDTLPEVLSTNDPLMYPITLNREPLVLHHAEQLLNQHGTNAYHVVFIHIEISPDEVVLLAVGQRREPIGSRSQLQQIVGQINEIVSDLSNEAGERRSENHRRDGLTPHSVQTDVIQRAAKSLRSQQTITATLLSILRDVDRMIDHDSALVWMVNQRNDTISTQVGRAAGKTWIPDWTLPSNWPPFARSLDGAEFFQTTWDEISKNSESIRLPELPLSTHVLIGPLLDTSQHLGIITLARTSSSVAFSEAEVSAFRTITELASIAISKSIAVEAERFHRQHAQDMLAITGDFNKAVSAAQTIAALQRGITRLLGIPHSHVALFDPLDPANVVIYGSRALREDSPDVRPPVEPGLLQIEQEILHSGIAVAGARMRELVAIPPYTVPAGMHGLAALPIRMDATGTDGILYLWTPLPSDSYEFTELTQQQLDLADSLCVQASVALERARLQDLAQRTAHEQRVLGQVAAKLSSLVCKQQMSDAVLEALSSIIPTELGRVAMQADMLVHPVTVGSLDDLCDQGTTLCEQLRYLEDHVLRSGAGSSGQLSDLARNSGTTCPPVQAVQAICWPLAADQLPFGTLTLLRSGTAAFATHERDLVAHVSSQLSLALQRAQSYEASVRARDEAEASAEVISAVLDVTNEMSRQQELNGVLKAMDNGLSRLMPFVRIGIYAANESSEQLDLVYFRSESGDKPTNTALPYDVGIAGWVARHHSPTQDDPNDTEQPGKPSRHDPDDRLSTLQVLGYPMIIEGELVGVLSMGRNPGETFSERELSILRIFTTHAASAMRNATLIEHNRDLYLGGIRALSSAVDANDPFTRGHSNRVAHVSRQIAETMHLPSVQVEQIEVAALLHDIGKIGIPDAILQKPTPLNQQERAIMMGHVDLGATILHDARTTALGSLVPFVRHHHEWWDGSGYPSALRATRIPLGARIIAVADAFDTITSDRPYRGGRSYATALDVLRKATGTQFDADVVDALVSVVDTGLLRPIKTPSKHHSGIGVAPTVSGPSTLPEPAGELGDLRPLGILVELAQITAHMTNLRSFVERLATMLSRRLDLRAVMISMHDSVNDQVREFVLPPSGTLLIGEHADRQVLDHIPWQQLPGTLGALDYTSGPHSAALPFSSLENTGVVPLVNDGNPVGLLMFEPADPQRYWKADSSVIEAVAPHVTAAVNIARIHEQAKEDALVDGLTGALNYRAFYRSLGVEIARGQSFQLIMFDVVGLKRLNDRSGHLAGDALLQNTVRAIREVVDPSSIVARIGGDEFIVVLRGQLDTGRLHSACMRIRDRLRRHDSAVDIHDVSLRYGWAAYPQDATTPAALVTLADKRMYGHMDDPATLDA